MKKLLLLAVITMANCFMTTPADPLSKTARKTAVDYFIRTKKNLLKEVRGLSQAQLQFKADPTRWSVEECLEHIALSENFIWQWARKTMATPATPEKRSEVKVTTEQIIGGTADRSHKVKTIPPLEPGKTFANSEEALRAFVNRRDSTIRYLRTTQDDLKDHFTDHPAFGTVDAYQVLIFLAAHTARHTLQIEEVKADPHFPKK